MKYTTLINEDWFFERNFKIFLRETWPVFNKKLIHINNYNRVEDSFTDNFGNNEAS